MCLLQFQRMLQLQSSCLFLVRQPSNRKQLQPMVVPSASSAKVAQASVLEHCVLGCAVAVPPALARRYLAAPDVEVLIGANTGHNGSAVDGSVGVPAGVVPGADQSLLWAPTASPQHSTAKSEPYYGSRYGTCWFVIWCAWSRCCSVCCKCT